ncbi:MAG: hypothetical protein IPI24_14215 [Ignavibacteria bacterium]|nr:hypothetical protein [Ignavibacteria bacterium]
MVSLAKKKGAQGDAASSGREEDKSKSKGKELERRGQKQRKQKEKEDQEPSDDEDEVEETNTLAQASSKGEKERKMDHKVLQAITMLLKDKAPKFADEVGEAPGDFLRFFHRAIEEALDMITNDEVAVKKVILSRAKEMMPRRSRAGAWLDRWETDTPKKEATWDRFEEDFKKILIAREEDALDEEIPREEAEGRGVAESLLGRAEDPCGDCRQKRGRHFHSVHDRNKQRTERQVGGTAHQGHQGRRGEGGSVLGWTNNERRRAARRRAQRRNRRLQHSQQWLPLRWRRRESRESKCFSCGKIGHIARQCPDRNERFGSGTCGYCGKHGHRDSVCRKLKADLASLKKAGKGGTYKEKSSDKESKKGHKKESKVSKKEDSGSESSETEEDGAYRAGGELPFADILIGGVKVETMLDSGATKGGFVSQEVAKKMKWVVTPEDALVRVDGFGDGGTARWGEAEVEFGGRKECSQSASPRTSTASWTSCSATA